MKCRSIIFVLLVSCLLIFHSCKDDGIGRNLDPHADWMTDLVWNAEEDVTLKKISMPGAHDAGMYLLSSCSVGGNACNTQTQDQNMTTMLNAGIRVFDVRPSKINEGIFMQHYTECGGLGCHGDLVENMLVQTKTFLDSHSELVVFLMSHFCSTGYNDTELTDLFTDILGDRLYKGTSIAASDFINTPLDLILDIEGGNGKAIILYEDAPSNSSLESRGIFDYSYFPLEGSYANSFEYDVMYADQLAKFNSFNSGNNRLFEMSWTMTLDTDLSISCFFQENSANSIQDYALPTNDKLGDAMQNWMNDGIAKRGKIPNIIWVDFADIFVTDACKTLTEMNVD